MDKQHITDTAMITTAMATLRQIFIHDEAGDEPFHPAITQRLLIFPYRFHFQNNVALTTALATIAKKDGDEGYYFRYFITYPDPPSEFDGLWYIPFYPPDPDAVDIAPLENVCFSPHGTWALMATYDDYGLLGGTEEFMDQLLDLLPNLTTQVMDFVTTMRDDPYFDFRLNIGWLQHLLVHIHGEEGARHIFHEAAVVYPEDTLDDGEV